MRREFKALRTTAIGLAITDQSCGFLRFLEPPLACSGNFGGAFSSKGGRSARGSCSSVGSAEAGFPVGFSDSVSESELVAESGELSKVVEEDSSTGSDFTFRAEARQRFLAGDLEEACFFIEANISWATAASSCRADP